MGFRFWRRIKIAPGVTLNLSKSGGSLSFGPRGARFTIGPRGKRVSAGIPGTGLFYTTVLPRGGSRGRKGPARGRRPAGPPIPARDRLDLGFFERLVTPRDVRALVEGCRELVRGRKESALGRLRESVDLADGACLAGFLAMDLGRRDEAEPWLCSARERSGELGRHLARYGISPRVDLAITEGVTAHIGADLRGVLLALVEVYQAGGRLTEARECLERLRRLEPHDVVVKLSLAELLLEEDAGGGSGKGDASGDAARRTVRLARGIENETPLHAALLLYKGRALRRLGLLEAARDVLTSALRRRKERSAGLLHAIRYERVLVYEGLGRARRARADLERIYAEDPDYEDVAARLGC